MPFKVSFLEGGVTNELIIQPITHEIEVDGGRLLKDFLKYRKNVSKAKWERVVWLIYYPQLSGNFLFVQVLTATTCCLIEKLKSHRS